MLIESANGARQFGTIRRNSAQFSDATAPPSTAPIFVIDAPGQVNVEPKAAAITGYSTAEMLGRVLVDAEVIKTEFRTSFAEVLTLAIKGFRRTTSSCRCTRATAAGWNCC